MTLRHGHTPGRLGQLGWPSIFEECKLSAPHFLKLTSYKRETKEDEIVTYTVDMRNEGWYDNIVGDGEHRDKTKSGLVVLSANGRNYRRLCGVLSQCGIRFAEVSDLLLRKSAAVVHGCHSCRFCGCCVADTSADF